MTIKNVGTNDYPSWFWACRERANAKDRTGYWCNRVIHAIENDTDLYVLAEEFQEIKKCLGGWIYATQNDWDLSALKVVVSKPLVPLTILTTDVLVDCLDTLNVGRKLSVR